MGVDDQRLTAVKRGALARTRTWNHRLGGGSYILFNYGEWGESVPQSFSDFVERA